MGGLLMEGGWWNVVKLDWGVIGLPLVHRGAKGLAAGVQEVATFNYVGACERRSEVVRRIVDARPSVVQCKWTMNP